MRNIQQRKERVRVQKSKLRANKKATMEPVRVVSDPKPQEVLSDNKSLVEGSEYNKVNQSNVDKEELKSLVRTATKVRLMLLLMLLLMLPRPYVELSGRSISSHHQSAASVKDSPKGILVDTT